jgi:DNA-binding transcriptional regulator YdaS (Cro superfamily)
MVVGLFMCVVGAALALVYLLAIRPQVASQQIGGPHPGPPPPPPAVPLA